MYAYNDISHWPRLATGHYSMHHPCTLSHTAGEHMKHVHNVKTLLAGVLMQFILTLFSPSPRSHSQAYVHLLLATTEVPALSQVPTPPRASVQLGFQGTCVRST